MRVVMNRLSSRVTETAQGLGLRVAVYGLQVLEVRLRHGISCHLSTILFTDFQTLISISSPCIMIYRHGILINILADGIWGETVEV